MLKCTLSQGQVKWIKKKQQKNLFVVLIQVNVCKNGERKKRIKNSIGPLPYSWKSKETLRHLIHVQSWTGVERMFLYNQTVALIGTHVELQVNHISLLVTN